MKFFIPALIIVGAVAIILSLMLFPQLAPKTPVVTAPTKSSPVPVKNPATATSSLIKNVSNRTTASGSAPAGFIGPPAGSVPHVNGPTGNPPNY